MSKSLNLILNNCPITCNKKIFMSSRELTAGEFSMWEFSRGNLPKTTNKLSKAFWEAIDNGRDPHVEWSILVRSSTYQPGAARCDLCLDEKLAILLADPSSTLSKRTELTGKCRHKNKFKLKKFL